MMNEAVERAGETGAEIYTFLVADVRGYTAFTQEHGDEAAAALALRFADVCREVVDARGGTVVELRGDEALAAFASARTAIRAAVDLQDRFEQERAAHPDITLPAGIGLDAGEAVRVEGGYRGGALNLAARLCTAAGPGEVLASETVVHLARRVPGLEYIQRGRIKLKGLPEAIPVLAISKTHTDSPAASHPARRALQGNFLGAQPSGPLIDRSAELACLRQALQEAANGAGRLVIIDGELGAGKTRLAQEAAALAEQQGFAVGIASGYELRQDASLYVAEDLLLSLRHEGLEVPWEGEPVPSVEQHDRVFRLLGQRIQDLTRTKPLALLVDDVHWADRASLSLLAHIARYTRMYPVCTVLTFRADALPAPLAVLALDLGRQGVAQSLVLMPLDAAATGELAAVLLGLPDVSPVLASSLHSRSQGNPLYVHEIVRALIDRGDAPAGALRADDLPLPDRIQTLTMQHVGRLDAETQALLHAASVLGTHFAFDDLVALSRRDEGAVEQSLLEATRAGFLRMGSSDDVHFRHVLVQESLYQQLPPRQRRRLHTLAGEVLEQHRDRVATTELAWHFLHAYDADRAFRYALEAGEEAEAAGALAEAQAQYRIAVGVLRGAAAADRSDQLAANGGRLEADALEHLGRVLLQLESGIEGRDALERAAQLYEAQGDRLGEARTVTRIAHFDAEEGRLQQARDRLQALRESAPPPSADMGRAFVLEAGLQLRLNSPEEAVRAARAAAAMAHAVEHEHLAAEARLTEVQALSALGRAAEIEHVLHLWQPHGDACLDLQIALARAYIHSGQPGRAQGVLRAVLPASEERAWKPQTEDAAILLAEIQIRLGRWTDAAAVLDRVDRDIAVLSPRTRARVQITRAELLLAQGPVALAEEVVRSVGEPVAEAALQAAIVHAEICLLQERPSEAVVALQSVDLATATAEADHRARAFRVLAAAGAMDEARLFESVPGADRDRAALIELLWGRGLLRLGHGERVPAARLLSAALHIAESAPEPLRAARIRLDRADALEGDEARAQRRLAVKDLQGLRSAPYLHQALRRVAEQTT